MNRDLFRSLARAIGGRVKSFLVQAAKDEAARAIRHFRAGRQTSDQPAAPSDASLPATGQLPAPSAALPASGPSALPSATAPPASGASSALPTSADASPISPSGRPAPETSAPDAALPIRPSATSDTRRPAPKAGAHATGASGSTPRAAVRAKGAARPATKRSGTHDAATMGVVDLNAASREELIALPGIGEARADAILQARPFAALSDLAEKKVLPASLVERLKDRIRVA